MTTLVFKIHIRALAATVWNCLWESENYKQWTAAFSESSHYKTDHFAEGNSIHFLSADGHGMFSIIEKLQENRFILFRHKGELINFAEQSVNEAQDWFNAAESYELIPQQGFIELVVSVDSIEAYESYMNATFPKALETVKSMAEAANNS